MAVTKQLNSKSNIKQYSGADFPVNPRQAVIARYSVDSTASQTVINLPWTVDTVNAQDNFFISIDGRVLTIGSANDYTMTSIDVLGFSSQVTLNAAIPAGLNIQAWKGGLKKESEFAQDARFTNVYEALNEGFQPFVKTSATLNATATTGSPAAGSFYSAINNRQSVTDFSQDLKPRLGVERFHTASLKNIQNETGPNGEVVLGVENDPFNQVRVVGWGWVGNDPASYGTELFTNVVGDFIEITFYGTGFNLLTYAHSAISQVSASVDGVQTIANIFSVLQNATHASAISYRNVNVILPIASGLSLGIHTVTLKYTVFNAGNALNVMGYEILNESSTLKTAPGVAYNQGKKITLSALDSQAFASGFTNTYGTVGTRGGRVLVYLDSTGNVKKDIQYVDATTGLISSSTVNHANEEVTRQYHWREFGVGGASSTDFTTGFTGGNATLSYVMDDNVTTLTGAGVSWQSASGRNIPIGLYANGATNYFTFMFVGTGLDIINDNSGGTDPYAIEIDNVVISSGWTAWIYGVNKIVSGLPYGTHTVKFTRNSASNSPVFTHFRVYGPKKPTLPSGAVELADYNIVADFSGTATTGTAIANNFQMPTGVITHTDVREFFYFGTGWSSNQFNQTLSGWDVSTGTNGDYVQFTFFGTGFQALSYAGGASGDFTISIDGSLNATGTARANGSNLGGGSYRNTASTYPQPARFDFTGLSLGTHTVKITKTSGGNLNIGAIHAITPIHSVKNNQYYDLQNTLIIGNQCISDNRQTTPVKDALSSKKSWAQALGAVTSASTNVSTPIPMPDMNCQIKTSGGALHIVFVGSFYCSDTANSQIQWQIYVDGFAIEKTTRHSNISPAINNNVGIADSVIVPVGPGVHNVQIYWGNGGGGTIQLGGNERNLTVREL